MLKSQFARVFVGAFLVFYASVLADSEEAEKVKVKVDGAVKSLQALDERTLELIARSEVRPTVESIQVAIQLISEVGANSKLSQEEKAKFIAQLSEECGKLFLRLTEPYQDPIPSPASNEELERKGYKNWFIRKAKRFLSVSLWTTQMALKDIQRFVWPRYDGHWSLPLFWSDKRRTSASRQITREVVASLEAELKKIVEKVGGDERAVAGLARILEAIQRSEPYQHRKSNSAMRYTIMAYGIIFSGFPKLISFVIPGFDAFPAPADDPFNLFLDPSPTISLFTFGTHVLAGDGLAKAFEMGFTPSEMSPLISGIWQLVFYGYVARIRRLGSGLDVAWEVDAGMKRMTPEQFKALEQCKSALKNHPDN